MTTQTIPRSVRVEALKYLNFKIDMRIPRIKQYINEEDGLNKIITEIAILKNKENGGECNICFEECDKLINCCLCSFKTCPCCYNKIAKTENNTKKYICPACRVNKLSTH